MSSVHECCLRGFQWKGTPTGRTSTLASNDVYIAGDNPNRAILFIHDLFGWTFPNIRLLADAYAAEANATVYVPDFFGGAVLPFDLILKSDWAGLDLHTFIGKNSREVREPEIFACARALRAQYKKVGAVGFCYGGWAVLRLGAKEHNPPLVDFISLGHPSMLTKKDIEEVNVPVQVLAPEIDQAYTDELKKFTFETVMKLGIPFDYQHYPGVEHSCFIRGDPEVKGDREALVRGKHAAVSWFVQFLSDDAELF